jgi:hypothetical protein
MLTDLPGDALRSPSPYRVRQRVLRPRITMITMFRPTAVSPFPVAEEISEITWRQIADGQPVLLLRGGRPAAVIVDLESWEEAELAISDLESGESGALANSPTP